MGRVDLVMAELTSEDPLQRHLEAVRQAAGRAASMTRRLIGEDIELRALLAPDTYRVRGEKVSENNSPELGGQRP